jgi:hypothetical protein
MPGSHISHWICEECGANIDKGESHKRSCATLQTFYRLIGLIPNRPTLQEVIARDHNWK